MAKQSTLKATIPVEDPISADGILGTFNLNKTSGSFAIQVHTINNTGSLDLVIEVSVDGTNFVEVSKETITDAENTALFDFPNGTGASFARISAANVTGTLEVDSFTFSGKELRS